MGHFDVDTLTELGVTVDAHGKMPDVVIYLPAKNWLLLIEAVTSHGPVDGKRHDELAQLFGTSSAGLVYVTAFPSRSEMARYISDISWETEVWVADAPDHLIHRLTLILDYAFVSMSFNRRNKTLSSIGDVLKPAC